MWLLQRHWKVRCEIFGIINNIIRASVDALCRDETDEISRDPHLKQLQTHSIQVTGPSKAFHISLRVFLYWCICPAVYSPAVYSTPWYRRTRICTYIHDFKFFVIFFLFSSVNRPTCEGKEGKTHTNWPRIQWITILFRKRYQFSHKHELYTRIVDIFWSSEHSWRSHNSATTLRWSQKV